jgi:hypothetical protein
MKKPRKKRSAPRVRQTQLKAATVETKSVPKGYKPPSKLRRPGKTESKVELSRPRRYTLARGVKAVRLEPQAQTMPPRGAQKGESR